MRKISLLFVALTILPSLSFASEYPSHWGDPPTEQTNDHVQLPYGYGYGSSTISHWIEANVKLNRFPEEWGNPPTEQAEDHVALPGKYGYGSSTLANWIAGKLDESTSYLPQEQPQMSQGGGMPMGGGDRGGGSPSLQMGNQGIGQGTQGTQGMTSNTAPSTSYPTASRNTPSAQQQPMLPSQNGSQLVYPVPTPTASPSPNNSNASTTTITTDTPTTVILQPVGSPTPRVNRSPSVALNAMPPTGTTGQEITIVAAGSDPDGDTLEYAFTYDGRTSAFTSNPVVPARWFFPGTYQVTVQVRDNNGGTDNSYVQVQVTEAPTPSPTPTPPASNPSPPPPVDPGDDTRNNPYGFTPTSLNSTQGLVFWFNVETGQSWWAPSGGWNPPSSSWVTGVTNEIISYNRNPYNFSLPVEKFSYDAPEFWLNTDSFVGWWAPSRGFMPPDSKWIKQAEPANYPTKVTLGFRTVQGPSSQVITHFHNVYTGQVVTFSSAGYIPPNIEWRLGPGPGIYISARNPHGFGPPSGNAAQVVTYWHNLATNGGWWAPTAGWTPPNTNWTLNVEPGSRSGQGNPFGFLPSTGLITTTALTPWYNTFTGQTWTFSSGGNRPPTHHWVQTTGPASAE